MEKLSSSEEEIMQAVWMAGEGPVKTIMNHMESSSPYNTIASAIKNLEKKGYLTSRLIGNTYLYKPVISESEFKQNVMVGVVKNYFDNSYQQLVNFFVEQKKISAKDLMTIANMIEEK